jgi:hypothetical protein
LTPLPVDRPGGEAQNRDIDRCHERMFEMLSLRTVTGMGGLLLVTGILLVTQIVTGTPGVFA